MNVIGSYCMMVQNPYKLVVCFEKRPFKIQMRGRLMSDEKGLPFADEAKQKYYRS